MTELEVSTNFKTGKLCTEMARLRLQRVGDLLRPLRPQQRRIAPSFAFRLLLVGFCLLPLVYCLLLAASAATPQSLSVYAPRARFTLRVSDLDGKAYVGIFELIEPLASSELKSNGTRWVLRIRDARNTNRSVEADLQEGSSTVKIGDKRVTLSAPARIDNHRLMLPLHGIGSVLIPLLGSNLVFHEASRRLFLGGAAELVTPELRKADTSTLVLHFPESVNPTIHSEGNSIELQFTRDPVVAVPEKQAFDDKLFSSMSFSEANGSATLTIAGAAPLLANFADGGRTILLRQAPAPAESAGTNPPAPPATIESPVQNSPALSSSVTPTFPRSNEGPIQPSPLRNFLVIIDPAHGGGDPGARIAPNLLEKDITLALARKLRQELQTRRIAVTLLRDGDSDLTLDQRVMATNVARPALFISLHAEPGSALRIYAPVLPFASSTSLDRNGFLPWQTAQSAFAADSASAAQTMAASMAKRQLSPLRRPAFLQPMHSLAAPAIAVEAPAGKNGLKISEEVLAGALADGVAARKAEIEAQK